MEGSSWKAVGQDAAKRPRDKNTSQKHEERHASMGISFHENVRGSWVITSMPPPPLTL